MTERNAALPGALLMLAGAFLIVWALSEWGVFEGTFGPTITKRRRTLVREPESSPIAGGGGGRHEETF